MVEGISPRDVVDQKSSGGSAIIGTSDRTESFLTGLKQNEEWINGLSDYWINTLNVKMIIRTSDRTESFLTGLKQNEE
jgi:hypothetical protein